MQFVLTLVSVPPNTHSKTKKLTQNKTYNISQKKTKKNKKTKKQKTKININAKTNKYLPLKLFQGE
jgi:hypothetical protein